MPNPATVRKTAGKGLRQCFHLHSAYNGRKSARGREKSFSAYFPDVSLPDQTFCDEESTEKKGRPLEAALKIEISL